MGRKKKGKRNEIDEYGMTVNCTGCRKYVLSGHGNQREIKNKIERFCDKCWKPVAEQNG